MNDMDDDNVTGAEFDRMFAEGRKVPVIGKRQSRTTITAPSMATVNRGPSTFGGPSKVLAAGTLRADVQSQPSYAGAS